MIIVPAILSDSLDTVASQLQRVTMESKLRRVQVDCIDPDFIDNFTIHPIDLLELDTQSLTIDIHLMTNDPINDVVECSQVFGIKTVIAQVERMASQSAFIEHVQSFGIEVGLSLDLHTELEALEPALLSKLSIVQVMGVSMGGQGREFGGEIVLSKLRQLSAVKQSLGLEKLTIAVDGGINPTTAKMCFDAGVEMLVAGSYLWNSSDLAIAIESLSL